MANGLWTHELFSLPHGHLHAILDPEMSDVTCSEYLVVCDHSFTAEVWNREEPLSQKRVQLATTPAQNAREKLEANFLEITYPLDVTNRYWLSLPCYENTTIFVQCPHSQKWGDWEQIMMCGASIWILESEEIDSEGHPSHWIRYVQASEVEERTRYTL